MNKVFRTIWSRALNTRTVIVSFLAATTLSLTLSPTPCGAWSFDGLSSAGGGIVYLFDGNMVVGPSPDVANFTTMTYYGAYYCNSDASPGCGLNLADSNLSVTVGGPTDTGPKIIAPFVWLGDVSLTVNGLTQSAVPTKSSQLPVNDLTLIQTTVSTVPGHSGITGDFVSTTGIPASGLDYLLYDGHLTTDGMDYVIGWRLAWTAGDNKGTGSFTLASGTNFEVDTPLADQTGTFPNGWNGADLTKNGAGTLILSGQNTYDGITTINGGTLAISNNSTTGIDGTIASSSAVALNGGILDISGLTGGSTTINNLSGVAGTNIELGSNTLDLSQTQNSTVASIITGSGGLAKNGSATLTLTGANTYGGGTLIDGGTLIATAGNVLGTGTVTNNSTLQLDFASNSTLANQLSGTGALNKTSSGVATLTAASSSQGSVNVANGTLELAQSGAFTTSGAYTTRVGTATQIDQNAELNVGTAFTQEAGSNLVVMADTTSPKITAATASLGGTLTITGLSNGAAPAKSSQLPGNQYTLIQTTGGITGDFISTNIPGTGLDYLLYDGRVSSNGLDYDLGFRLAWTDGGYSQGTGDFTMVGGSTFEVDTVLSNQAGPFINGWDGKTLTKSGAGSLILSGQNIYTGATIIDGGTIYIANNSTTGVDGTIADSSNVAINSGTLDISKIAGTSTTIQNLSGTAIGNITLAGKNLTVDQSQNLTYAGNFDASNGSITKNGTGELTLSGQTLYTGNTTVNQGTLTLDGTSGGAQLVSNVIGTSGAVLNIINRASLTGTIDPLDVNITTGGIWNVTGNSNVLALTSNAGNINFIPPPVNSTNPADYKTITATSLNGSNGSTITMNTNLAANIGDRIDTKTTSGSQTININNTGGTISGTPLALEIINVANSTASTGTFTLGNAGGTVDVGVYKYQLVQGSTENNLSDVGSWYLAALENGGGGNGGGGGGQPELSNQAQSIIAASDQAGTWIMQTDSLLQRMGELRITDYNQAKHGMQSWVRGYGWQANVNTNNSQVAYKSTEYGFDAGTDVTTQFENSKLSTGIFAGMSLDKRRIGDNAGHDNIDTIYGGIYGTWVTSKGFHIDAVGRGGYLDTEVNANDAPNYSKAKYNNWGILGSLEIGQQIKSKEGWYIEPQIQGTIVHFTSANFTTSGDSLGVEQRASSSYDIRAGIVAGKSIATDRAGIFQPYIKGMYGQTWTDGGDVNINGENFKGNSAGNRYEIGGGIVWQVTGDKQFYADYEYIKGPRIEVPWKADAGFRVVW